MIFGRTSLCLTVLALSLLELPALPADPAAWPVLRRQQASRIVGMTVENADGDYLGKVKDFVVDLERNEISFVIVTTGGFLKIGSHNKIVPASAVSMATAKRNVIYLPVTKVRWASAPTFKKRELASYRSGAPLQALLSFYGMDTALTHRHREVPPRALAATGRVKSPLAAPPEKTALFASELTGQTMRDPQRESLGKVSDLLVDLFHHKSPLVLLASNGWNPKHEGFAIPLELIEQGTDNRLTFAANRTALEEAAPLNQNEWRNEAPGVPRVYRFENKSPDNTARNVRDRDGSDPTPLTQSEDSHDIQITKKIRHSIFHDRLLSFTAKNIKVITSQGKVTLRGPVKRAAERSEIVCSAAGIAGAQNVVDELDVIW